MAKWGYEKGFVIEHVPKERKRISCRDCYYYDSSDYSCMKRPLFLPVDGYNSWRNCKDFELSETVSHYTEKYKYIEALRQKEQTRKITAETMITQKNISIDDRNSMPPKGRQIGKYIFMLPMSYIYVAMNKRKNVNKKRIQKVIDYYKVDDQFSKPLIVKLIKNRYRVESGSAMFYAARALELEEIPVMLDSRIARIRHKLCVNEALVISSSYGEGRVKDFDLQNVDVFFPKSSQLVSFNLDNCIEKQTLIRPHFTNGYYEP